MSFEGAGIFPMTAGVNGGDHLTLGGCDVADLTSEFGTPLYVYDEATLRRMCREFVGEFGGRYPNTRVLYAAKAYINPVLAKLLDTKEIERVALAKLDTKGCSRYFVHESEVTTYRDIFLKQIGDHDRWLSHGWVLDARRLNKRSESSA